MAARDYDVGVDGLNPDAWLCQCGEFVEDGLHCPMCGQEPPWGCPCSGCQDGDDEDVDLDDYLDPGDFIV